MSRHKTEVVETDLAQVAPCGPCETPDKTDLYCAAIDQMAAAVKKLTEAGLGGEVAARTALEVWRLTVVR